MAWESDTSEGRLARIVVQKLESLHRAGATHLRRSQCKIALAPKDPSVATAESLPKSPLSGREKEGVRGTAPIPFPTTAEPLSISTASLAHSATETEDREQALAAVARQVAACTRCAELARTRTQTVFGVGNPHARLAFLGEAPGADEDRQGEPFVGRAGRLLTDMIQKGMRLRREDVYILNILRCRPPNNRAPLPEEAANCREYLDAQLAIIRPEFICCLGAIAAQNLLNTSVSISKLRGRFFEYRGAKVICTYHPAYLLRTPSAKRDTWQDLQLLMAEMGL